MNRPILLGRRSFTPLLNHRRKSRLITESRYPPTAKPDVTRITAPADRTSTDGSSSNSSSDLFGSFDVLSSVPAPASSIETIFPDGFLFASGVQWRDGSGAVIVHNQAFRWRAAERGNAIEKKAIESGVLEFTDDGKAWGILDVLYPKPELLIVGTGGRTLFLSKPDRARITEMGIRMDVMDTSHAAAQYNLLATERAHGQVAAALLVDDFGGKKSN